MKKILILTVAVIIFISNISSIAFSTPPDEESLQHMEMNTSLSTLLIQDKDNYLSLKYEGMDTFITNPQQPKLPTRIETYTFPLGTKIKEVECIPLETNSQFLSKPIEPAPQPRISGENPSTEKNEICYQSTAYPNKWFDYDVGRGIHNGERCIILKIQYYPVQYYPALDKISVATSFDTTLTFSEETIISQSKTDEKYDLIILTPQEFQNALTPLSNHKINRGISTKIITLTDIYYNVYFPNQGRDDPEKIKYFIKNAVEQWDTRYVMLVGGDDEFPTRITHVYIDENAYEPELFISDLYYADLYDAEGLFMNWDSNENNVFGEFNWTEENLYDEVDLYPDVYLGRLACTSEDEVSNVVDKIISYETNENYKKDWFSNVIVIGGDTFPGDPDKANEGEVVGNEVIDAMDGFLAKKLYASEGSLGVNLFITNAIEQGAGFVGFAGHGNQGTWSTHPHEDNSTWIPVGGFNSRNALNLENKNKLPIVVISACSVGRFDQSDQCISWSFVKNPDGGGIASFGTTALGYGDIGYNTSASATGKMYIDTFKAYSEDKSTTFGEMWANSLNRFIYTNMNKYDYKTVEQWQPFGDPSLQIAKPSASPLPPAAPTGPTQANFKNKQIYQTVTTDPENDTIYYKWDWGDGTYSDWIGPFDSGEPCETGHRWDEKGSYQISAQAKDDNGRISDWSPPLSISLAKEKTHHYSFLEFFRGLTNLFSFFR